MEDPLPAIPSNPIPPGGVGRIQESVVWVGEFPESSAHASESSKGFADLVDGLWAKALGRFQAASKESPSPGTKPQPSSTKFSPVLSKIIRLSS